MLMVDGVTLIHNLSDINMFHDLFLSLILRTFLFHKSYQVDI